MSLRRSHTAKLIALLTRDGQGVRPLAALALVVGLAGCGGGHGRDSGTPVAGRIAAWSDAAVAYNQIVGQCARQPNPVRGYWDECTRDYRRSYSTATTRLLRAVSGCEAAKPVAAQVRAESAALSAESKWNRRMLDDVADYTGPGLLGLRARSETTTKRATTVADRLSKQLRSGSC